MSRRLVTAALGLAVVLLAWGCAAPGGFRGAAEPSLIGGPACLALLDRDGVSYRTVAVSDPHEPRCAIETGVRVGQLGVPLIRPAVMNCALAERVARFEREAVQPLALADLGRGVTRLDHLGTYSCRAQTSGRLDRLSQHAYGNAFDLSGFRLADGRTLSVERDWNAPGPEGAFLHHVARAACRYFSVVLTPDSNLQHYNHFHLDIGPGQLCSGT